MTQDVNCARSHDVSIGMSSCHSIPARHVPSSHVSASRYASFPLMLLALLLLAQPLRAGSDSGILVTFTGRVVDSASGDPLIGATIQIEQLRRGAMTDIDGRFVLADVRSGVHTITVRYIGHRPHVEEITLTRDVHREFRLAAMDVELPTVEVLAEANAPLIGSTHPTAVMAPEDVDRHRGQTLGEIVEHIPGVALMQTGASIAKPVIRGLHSQRVLVVNAGLTQEGQQWGGEHAPEIDPFAPERIEVIKGAAGVEYGAGAIGGVIRIEPGALPRHPGIGGTLSLNGFSNNSQGAASLMLEGATALLPGASLRVQGSMRRAGASRARDHVIGNSGFDELDGAVTAGWTGDRVKLSVLASTYGTELGIYPGSHIGNSDDLLRAIAAGQPLKEYPFSYDILAPRQVISHDRISAQGGWIIPGVGQVQAQVGMQQNHRQEFDSHRRWFDTLGTGSSSPAFDLTLTSSSGEVKFRHDPIGGFFGSAGVSVIRQVSVGNSLAFLIPNSRVLGGGAFLMESWTAGALTLNGGVRWDQRSTRVYAYAPKNITDATIDHSSVSGVLGMIWQSSERWSAAVNVGTAWRPPSINELYSDGVHHGTAQYEIGDPLLRPERSLSIDGTFTCDFNVVHAEVSAYANAITDFIMLVPDTRPTLTLRGAFPTFRYGQTDALLTGGEISVLYQVTEDVRVSGSTAIVRGGNRSTGEPLIHMPADRWRAAVHVHLPAPAWMSGTFAELSILAVPRQTRVPSMADYAPPPPGYVLVNLDAGSEMALLSTIMHIGLSIRNLFDVAYRDYLSRFRYFIDDPGRDIVLRLQIPFGRVPK